MVLILLPLLCNHDKLISEKKGEGWLVIGRFKVGSVLGMINKKVSAQFTYKPAWSTEKMFTYKNFDIYDSMYIEERGWVKAQILLMNRWKIQVSRNNLQIYSIKFGL